MGSEAIKLSVQSVCKSFSRRNSAGDRDHVPVLRNVNFEVPQGEIVSLIGESGCGKTTLAADHSGLGAPGFRLGAGGRCFSHQAQAAIGASCFSKPVSCHGVRRGRTSNSAWNCSVFARPSVRAAPADSCWGSSGSGTQPSNIRTSSPVACSSASAWRGRSRSTRPSCSWTNPSVPSMPRLANCYKSSCCAFSQETRKDDAVRDP